MTWDFFTSLAVGASILGAILGVVAWVLSHGTNRLISQGHADTRALLDRMDERADERHRDVVEILRKLREE